jgi:hypothetical protein
VGPKPRTFKKFFIVGNASRANNTLHLDAVYLLIAESFKISSLHLVVKVASEYASMYRIVCDFKNMLSRPRGIARNFSWGEGVWGQNGPKKGCGGGRGTAT